MRHDKIINNSLTYCDGYGAVYALKRKGIYSAKIPGAYLWLSIIERFYKTKSFYFLGAKQEVIEKSKSIPVIVDFWAPWCEPCKQIAPILDKLVASSNGRVVLTKMNIDEHPEISQQLQIQSIPAIFFQLL